MKNLFSHITKTGVLQAATLLLFLCCTTFAGGQSNPQLLDMMKRHATKKFNAGGSGGGSPWEDPQFVTMNGPITKVVIRCGNAIDNIQFFYGGSPGDTHGGGGGEEKTYEVPAGFEIVRVRGRAGWTLDNLQFVVRNAAGEIQQSPVFGGGGGDPFDYGGENNQPLRWVTGRSGRLVDYLEFTFGYPVKITGVTVDDAKMAEQLAKAKPVSIDNYKYKNTTGSASKVTYRLDKSVSSSATASFQNSTKFTLGQKIGLNVEFVASSEISWSVETAFTTTNTSQTTTTSLQGWSTDVPIPANQEVRINVYSYMKEVDVPMYYVVTMYDPNTLREIDHINEQGTFKGVLYSSLVVEPAYYNLDGTPVNNGTPQSSLPKLTNITRRN